MTVAFPLAAATLLTASVDGIVVLILARFLLYGVLGIFRDRADSDAVLPSSEVVVVVMVVVVVCVVG